MKGSAAWLFVLCLVGGLAWWLGPRPVYEPWVAEPLTMARARELGLERPLLDLAEGGARHAAWANLALANGISVESLPAPGHGDQLFDADNDGDLDLFSPGVGREIDREARQAGQEESPTRFSFYLNDGAGRFQRVERVMGPAFMTPRAVRSSLAIDLDEDGRIDLAFILGDGSFLVLWNRLEDRRFLRLRLLPALGRSLEGESARVELAVGKKHQVQLVSLARVEAFSAERTVHFGLGDAPIADRVTVRWPSGAAVELSGLLADREYEVAEGKNDE